MKTESSLGYRCPHRFSALCLRRAKSFLQIAGIALLMAPGIAGCKSGATVGGSTPETAKQSVKNLRSLGLSLNMYVGDHRGTFPNMTDAASLKTALSSYSRDENAYLSPVTNQPYQPNASLSGRSLSSLSNPAGIVSFYEPTATDGKRIVGFADGHAAQIEETQWPSLKNASGIP